MTNRLFLALDIPEEYRNELISIRNKLYNDSVKWEPAEKLHLTIKFLGQTEVSLIDNIWNSLKSTVSRYQAFETAFTKFGMFYRNKKPAILWVGLYASRELYEFVQDVDNSLAEFGFEREKRKFKPHITLLRFKGKENISKMKVFKDYEFKKNDFLMNKFVLFKSILKPSGSEYHKIKEIELKN